MKVLVTGGAGFIGSHVVDRLVAEDCHVAIVDNLSTGLMEHVNGKAVFYRCDIGDGERLERIFASERPDYLIHHAAQISVQNSLSDPLKDARVNIMGTLNLLNCCRDFGVKKMIYASSAAVYGNPEYLPVDENHSLNPLSPYGISKHTPEHYIKMYADSYGLNYTVLRYANAYGPRQDAQGEGGVVSVFIDHLLRDDPIVIYGDGEQTRDFVYAEDLAEANLAALGAGDYGIFNISTSVPTSVKGLLEAINEVGGSYARPLYGPARPGDIRDSYLSNQKARLELGWQPKFSLYQGLELTLKYYMRMCMEKEMEGAESEVF
ncbi:NAD dependent epimerase/dehydratase family [Acididesulfobacillus acetoxydans]|uniref:NAD dependent epimerase/dehydratase family n=1 Tax=Acididesulfobacillus acetoxydans TaxID=1561005 RepID=A0A8S0X7A8_9FIRM|nr:NAD-dependent epimerase/dehydratase family protein [Acididesulfobacillus acetoxydans]CAA7603160.1 NAD dependent epimerase/dehydratase family [Acididesulfobacillus acetoxydans]CEJ07612.1 UDP-glucose 4-epimerase [Acididesulfobacillus acetoxydans]